MRSRKLVLRKETLSALESDELSAVVGASHQCVTYTIVLTGCMCTAYAPSLNVDCPTIYLKCPPE